MRRAVSVVASAEEKNYQLPGSIPQAPRGNNQRRRARGCCTQQGIGPQAGECKSCPESAGINERRETNGREEGVAFS